MLTLVKKLTRRRHSCRALKVDVIKESIEERGERSRQKIDRPV